MNVEQSARTGVSSEAPTSALHVGKYFPPFAGGMERFLADLLEAQRNDGLRVGAIVHDHRRWLRGERTPAASFEQPIKDGKPDDGRPIPLYRVPSMGRLLYAPISPQFPFWLSRAIRGERPKVLHLHLPNTSAFWALLLPEARKIPWVIHWHADVVPSRYSAGLKLAYPFYHPLEQRLLRKAAFIVATSPDYLESSKALRPWRGKCRVIPIGINPGRIPRMSDNARRRAESRWGNATFRVLTVGRLTYYKGHEHLIEAMREVPGTRLIVVGDGERREFLSSLVADLGMGERIVMTGSLPPDHMHALLESCDCLCLPSIERTEAFGVALVEAMAHGKAVVACDIPGSGVGWVVRNGETGYLVSPENPGAMARALASLARDREASSRMGGRGRKRYENLFQIGRVSDEIRHLYERASVGGANDG